MKGAIVSEQHIEANVADSKGAHAPVGRFAPSPSGRMHLGNVFASLVAWLSVRGASGKIVLRIEDLDPRTQHGPWTELLIDDLRWLGLEWDEGPVRQSDRMELYHAAIENLREQGLLYPCFCTRAELHAASAPHASDGTPIYAGVIFIQLGGDLPPSACAFQLKTIATARFHLSTASLGFAAKCSNANAETSSCGAATESTPTS